MPRINLDVRLPHHGLARKVTRKGADDRAVPRCLVEDIIGSSNAGRCRHVLDDDGGSPRDVLTEIACEQATADVMIVAHRVPHDQADLLALIEVLHRLRLRGLPLACQQNEGCQRKAYRSEWGAHRKISRAETAGRDRYFTLP